MKQRLLVLALLLTLVYSGVEVARTAHEVRALHAQLETLRAERDEALLLQSQLLIEIGAVASLAKVQAVAEQQLDMRFPERLEQLSP